MLRIPFLTYALCLTVAAFTLSALPITAAEQATARLPGGATSLQETFNDWQVACVVQATTKRCALTQEQVNQQSRQRVLAIELSVAGDTLDGVLLMPFGLALERGVTLQIDEQPSPMALKFRTCVPAGCLVPLRFDTKTIAALRSGSSVKTRAIDDTDQEQLYTISLKGFAQALDRVSALSN
jgi:invasion protein IalB